MVEAIAAMEIALAAATRGGDVILASARPPEGSAKGLPGDYVTEVDLASERAIGEVLRERTPGIPILGEETGGDAEAPERWVVDPLDGTTNFLHGFPAVGVSVALVRAGHPVAGCVHAPVLDETFVAAGGSGAWRQGRDGQRARLRVATRSPARSVVGTGFPFRRKAALLDRYLRAMGAALRTFEDLRRPGAASLDLAWVAAGVFDGFFELALSPWDVAAGGLLIEEAGGIVTDWSGGDGWLAGDILAGPPDVHHELLRIAAESGA